MGGVDGPLVVATAMGSVLVAGAALPPPVRLGHRGLSRGLGTGRKRR
uniref:Uncharacterized protein n=1 Tax=Arundo donax TaxID=35708 RepID=A0A0A8XSI5_ARUDO